MNVLPKRKSIRLKHYDYRSKGIYHVTICAREKKCLFGTIDGGQMLLNAAGRAAEEGIDAIPGRYLDVEVVSHVVMPNHVHLLLAMCVAADARNGLPAMQYSLGQIVGAYKAGVSRELGYSVWQPRFYEHIIRDENDLRETVEYIQNNPAAWSKDDYFLPAEP